MLGKLKQIIMLLRIMATPAAAFRFAGIAQTGQKAPAFRRLAGN